MPKYPKEFNNHHLIQKKDGGSNHPDNIVRMEILRHNGLHHFFGVEDTLPIEKVIKILEFHKTCIDQGVFEEIKSKIDYYTQFDMEIYKGHCKKDIIY